MYLYGMIFNLWAYTWSQGSLGSVFDPSAGEFDEFCVMINIWLPRESIARIYATSGKSGKKFYFVGISIELTIIHRNGGE